MRKYGKWLLVLGILAANPAWASADGFLSGLRPTLPQSKDAQRQANLERAQQVMGALKQARVDGYDVRVEVRGDTVKVDGKVRNVNHRALAEQACQQVPGIKRVLNNLKYVPSGGIQQTAGRYTDSALRPATYNVVDGGESGIQQVHFQKPGKRKPTPKKQSTFRPRQSTPRPAMPQRSTAPNSRQSATAEPWSTQRPKSLVQAPQPTRELPKRTPATLTAKSAVRPPAVPPTKTPEITFQPLAVPPASDPKPKTVAQPADFAPAPAPKVEQASPLDLTTAMKTQKLENPAQPAGPGNQQIAQNIASSLSEVGLVGYNIEVRYENGIASLNGEVPTAQQIQAAGFAASRVPGVKTVKNDLKIGGPISQTGFNQAGPYANPQFAAAQFYPASMPGNGMGAPMGGGMGAPSPIGGAGNYSNPQLPSHAWPAYAQYPNSAAVSYPKQHSASAFPYIGPFYPYPQVPLGWREVSLQWDDGYWQLDFEQKKDAWYWLWNPKNWH